MISVNGFSIKWAFNKGDVSESLHKEEKTRKDWAWKCNTSRELISGHFDAELNMNVGYSLKENLHNLNKKVFAGILLLQTILMDVKDVSFGYQVYPVAYIINIY